MFQAPPPVGSGLKRSSERAFGGALSSRAPALGGNIIMMLTQVPSLLAPGHWYRYSGRTVASPRLRPRSKPAGLRRADLTSLAPIFYRISRMIGARSSGHLREGRSRGQFLASMRIGACESAPASRCALIIAVCKPAGLASRAASETPKLNRPSQPCCVTNPSYATGNVGSGSHAAVVGPH
jgi:hypothetical protein